MTTHQSSASVIEAEKKVLEARDAHRAKKDLDPKKPEKARLGLAFSGGGIRSACFNLGMLQAVDERDLLERADYVSTVSGGGYIGAWLLSCLKNLKSKPGFRPKDAWKQIRYTQGYARYLAPQGGAFSPDTWTILMIWLRNTVLLQAMLASFLGAVFLLPRLWKVAFDAVGKSELVLWPAGLAALLALGATLYQADRVAKGEQTWGAGRIHGWIVWPLIVAGGLLAAGVWQEDSSQPEYMWQVSVVVAVVAALAAAVCAKGKGRIQAAAFGVLCGAMFYPMISVLERVQWYWDGLGRKTDDQGDWYAALFLEPLYLLALFVVVILLIGLCGKLMEDKVREWWSRLGALLGIYTLGLAAVGVIAVFGPWLVLWLWERAGAYVTAGGFSVGAAITAVGALTGTRGDPDDPPLWKKLALAAAPALFVLILILVVSTGLHVVLGKIAGEKLANITATNYWYTLARAHGGDFWPSGLPWFFAALVGVTGLLSWRVDLNEFSMNQFYRNRLVRCFMGASRLEPGPNNDVRRPNRFTGFDMKDDYPITELKGDDYSGPIPIVNTAVNLTGGGDAISEGRRASNFFFTPYHCGCTETGFELMDGFPGPGTMTLGAAIATSGAAASPNMGYHTSTPIAFLLTFFNVRLGWWVPNPGVKRGWRRTAYLGLPCLLQELFGSADVKDEHLYLSDGGHFENLAVYELIRRKCRYIVVGDGEEDGEYVFNALGSLIRKCRTDFGVDIDIDIMPIRSRPGGRYNEAQFAVGTIHYKDVPEGTLIYVKSSLSGNEPTDIMQYAFETPEFPHESTADQFFNEAQFESYRKLGRFIGGLALDSSRPMPQFKPHGLQGSPIADEIRAVVS